MKKKKCPNCGVNKTPGYDFCLSCGLKFDTDKNNINSKKKILYAIIQLIIGMIIGIIIILVLLYIKILPIVFFPITIIVYLIIIIFIFVVYKLLHG